MLRFRHIVFSLIIFSLILSACANKSSAPDAVENYLKAKITSDAEKLVNLSCKDWEAQALLDAAPFESVDATFEGMSCKEAGKEDKFTLVTCEGILSFEYQGELRQQNLNEVSYLAIKENGEWKMCGEKE